MNMATDKELLTFFEKMTAEYKDAVIHEEYDPTEIFFENKEYFEYLVRDPSGKQFLESFCFYFLVKNDYQKIITFMTEAIKHQPDSYMFQYYLAVAYYLTGDIEKALSIARNLDISRLQEEIDDMQSYLATVDDEPIKKEHISIYENIDLQKFKGKGAGAIINDLLSSIDMFVAANMYEDAIDCYKLIIKNIGDVPCLLAEMGQLYMWLNQYKEAKKCLSKALQDNPGLYRAYRSLATIHRLLNEHEQAVGVLKKASKKFPEDDLILLELATSYLKLEHIPKAKECIKKALVIDPNIEHSLSLDPLFKPLFPIIS